MSYLFLGNDRPLKDQKINEFKKKYLAQEDALHFDYALLWGNKLDPKELKKSLQVLPVVEAPPVGFAGARRQGGTEPNES